MSLLPYSFESTTSVVPLDQLICRYHFQFKTCLVGHTLCPYVHVQNLSIADRNKVRNTCSHFAQSFNPRENVCKTAKCHHKHELYIYQNNKIQLIQHAKPPPRMWESTEWQHRFSRMMNQCPDQLKRICLLNLKRNRNCKPTDKCADFAHLPRNAKNLEALSSFCENFQADQCTGQLDDHDPNEKPCWYVHALVYIHQETEELLYDFSAMNKKSIALPPKPILPASVSKKKASSIYPICNVSIDASASKSHDPVLCCSRGLQMVHIDPVKTPAGILMTLRQLVNDACWKFPHVFGHKPYDSHVCSGNTCPQKRQHKLVELDVQSGDLYVNGQLIEKSIGPMNLLVNGQRIDKWVGPLNMNKLAFLCPVPLDDNTCVFHGQDFHCAVCRVRVSNNMKVRLEHIMGHNHRQAIKRIEQQQQCQPIEPVIVVEPKKQLDFDLEGASVQLEQEQKEQKEEELPEWFTEPCDPTDHSFSLFSGAQGMTGPMYTSSPASPTASFSSSSSGSLSASLSDLGGRVESSTSNSTNTTSNSTNTNASSSASTYSNHVCIPFLLSGKCTNRHPQHLKLCHISRENLKNVAHLELCQSYHRSLDPRETVKCTNDIELDPSNNIEFCKDGSHFKLVADKQTNSLFVVNPTNHNETLEQFQLIV